MLKKLKVGNLTPMTERGGDQSAKDIVENNNESVYDQEDQF